MNYFRNVSIEAEDSVECSFSKMSEEKYTAIMHGFTQNTVRFNVFITEDGCPTISYPFEVSVRGGSSATDIEKDKEPTDKKKSAIVNATGKVKSRSKGKSSAKKEEKKVLFVPK
jgi:hypothetical protein